MPSFLPLSSHLTANLAGAFRRPFPLMVRGKKAAATADPAGDVAPPKKMKGDWESSSTNKHHLTSLRAGGRLPVAGSGKIRCVGNEVIPTLASGSALLLWISSRAAYPSHYTNLCVGYCTPMACSCTTLHRTASSISHASLPCVSVSWVCTLTKDCGAVSSS